MDKPEQKKSFSDKVNEITMSAAIVMCVGYLGTIMLKASLPLFVEIWTAFR